MDLVIGRRYHCIVKKFVERGAIVELEDGSTQFLHVSKMHDRYVRYPYECVYINQQLYPIAIRSEKQDVGVELSLRKSDLYPIVSRQNKPRKQFNSYNSSKSDRHKQVNKILRKLDRIDKERKGRNKPSRDYIRDERLRAIDESQKLFYARQKNTYNRRGGR